MKKAKSFGYIMDIPLYAQKLADSKRAASAQSEKISEIASNFMQAKKFKSENLKAFVENTELPTEPTEKIVGRYIEAKRKHKKLMEATKAKAESIKNEIGYSVFQFQDSLQESDNFNF